MPSRGAPLSNSHYGVDLFFMKYDSSTGNVAAIYDSTVFKVQANKTLFIYRFILWNFFRNWEKNLKLFFKKDYRFGG